MAYAKINSITNANMAKVSSIAKAALGKIGGIDAPASGFANAKSLVFDGSDEILVVDGGTKMVLDVGSFGLWVKIAGGYSLTPFMIHTGYLFHLNYSGGNVYPFVFNPIVNVSGSTVLSDGNWHFITVTVSGGSGVMGFVKIYVDGAEDGSNNYNRTYTTVTDQELKIGRYILNDASWSGYYMNGNIDEIAIWKDKVLTAAEVTALYNSGTPIDLSSDSGDYVSSGDLDHWWRMGDGDSFATIEDNVGSYDFTMTNMESGDIVSDVPS